MPPRLSPRFLRRFLRGYWRDLKKELLSPFNRLCDFATGSVFYQCAKHFDYDDEEKATRRRALPSYISWLIRDAMPSKRKRRRTRRKQKFRTRGLEVKYITCSSGKSYYWKNCQRGRISVDLPTIRFSVATSIYEPILGSMTYGRQSPMQAV